MSVEGEPLIIRFEGATLKRPSSTSGEKLAKLLGNSGRLKVTAVPGPANE
jgi:hypothetical protein